MSYLGLVKPIFNSFLKDIPEPKILEIGIDQGQTMLPMIQNLVARHRKFTYTAVDILLRDDLVAQLYQLAGVNISGWDDYGDGNIILQEANSLNWLVDVDFHESFKFDLVLLDGDHNYSTVLKELHLLQKVLRPESIIVCDDFNGRWSETDLFYIEKEEYRGNQLATPRSESPKQGVGNAVKDFLVEDPRWNYFDIPPFEPAVLYRSDIWKKPRLFTTDERQHMRDLVFTMERQQPKGESSETDMG